MAQEHDDYGEPGQVPRRPPYRLLLFVGLVFVLSGGLLLWAITHPARD